MFAFFRSGSNRLIISELYQRIAGVSRHPGFYTDLGVPLEGRFNVLVLHLAIILRHMRNWPAPADDVARDLTDHFFEQMDDVLREIGVSDIKVPKRMKEMAGAFLGKASAYDAAFASGSEQDLIKMLRRNIILSEDGHFLMRYAFEADRIMHDSCLGLLLRQDLKFPAPTKPAGEF